MFVDLHPLFHLHNPRASHTEPTVMCRKRSKSNVFYAQHENRTTAATAQASTRPGEVVLRSNCENHVTCLHCNSLFEIKIALWTVRCFWGFTFLFCSFVRLLLFLAFLFGRFSRGKREYSSLTSPMPFGNVYAAISPYFYSHFCVIFFSFCFSFYIAIHARSPFFALFIFLHILSRFFFSARAFHMHSMSLALFLWRFFTNAFDDLEFLWSKKISE